MIVPATQSSQLMKMAVLFQRPPLTMALIWYTVHCIPKVTLLSGCSLCGNGGYTHNTRSEVPGRRIGHKLLRGHVPGIVLELINVIEGITAIVPPCELVGLQAGGQRFRDVVVGARTGRWIIGDVAAISMR